MDQPRIQRLLRLMNLMSGQVNYTIEELAKRTSSSVRTIYRYIESMKAAGFVVTKLWANTYKLEKMPDVIPEFENLMYFSEEECYVIYQMIDSMVPTNSLRRGIKEKLSVIYDSTAIGDYETRKCNSAHVKALKMAARDKKKVILRDYESGNSHTIRDRLVEPFGFTAEFIDVFAYDLEAGKNKIF